MSESDIYHVITRGVGRSILFEDDADRLHYLELLDKALDEYALKLYAWCLMDNHVHLLLKGELTKLSATMKRLSASYALYLNTRYGRVGHLFQGRFKSEPVDGDTYFLTVVRYIHQNPLKAGLAGLDEYRWSSYHEYFAKQGRTDTSLALAMLGGVQEFKEFHEQDDPKAACLNEDGGRQRRSNDEALRAAREILAPIKPEEVSGLPRKKRDEALRELKSARISVRQIERITGVSKSIVAKA